MSRIFLVIGLLLLSACVQAVPPADSGTTMSSSSSSVADAYADIVHVAEPLPGTTVPSTFTVTGEARGPWYFEASFPVSLEDTEGNVIVETHAEAQGEWMTEDFVPFTATLDATPLRGKDAVLVVKNDNPSGLPENEKEVRIPIHIAE